MLTKFSIWLSYIASCEYVFILQLISKFCVTYAGIKPAKYKSFIDHLRLTWKQAPILFTILVILIALSIVWNDSWKRKRNNTRITHRPTSDNTLEVPLSMIAYLAMVLSFNFDIPGLLFSVAIMLALGFGIVQTGNMHMCLYFFLHGYHVLSLDNVRILTKFSMEEYLLKLEENPNGLEARELTKRVYIIFPTN